MPNNHHASAARIQPLLWGLLHGLNDFTAGYMLANYTFHNNYSSSFLLIVIYAIIGFGAQLPVGFWMDHTKKIKPFAIAACTILPLAIAGYFFDGTTGILLSGIASALVHVTGGTVCILTCSSQSAASKSGPLALFTAPGVLGLTLGGIAGNFSVHILWLVLIVVLLLSYLIFKNHLPVYQSGPKKEQALDVHDWLMLGILLLMCFRSFIFDIINTVAQQYPNGILIIGISAFAGKIIGGFTADAVGYKRFVYISLPAALLLLQFGKENIYALAAGIACLQSSVPITLLLMCRSLPLYPATATALSVGTSVAFAGLPLYLIDKQSTIINGYHNAWLTALVFVVLLLCWVYTERFLLSAGLNRAA